MKFVTEAGIILKHNMWSPQILQVIDGHLTHVDFPQEALQKFHKDMPGAIWALAHTHGPMHYQLSKRDELTLKAQAISVSPYPSRLITVAQTYDTVFRVSIYLGRFETLESWIMRGKKGVRNWEIIPESSYDIDFSSPEIEPWERILIGKSYD